MRKCRVIACISTLFIAFIYQHIQAQDSVVIKKADSVDISVNPVLDQKQMDSIDKELKALFGISKSHVSIGINYLSNNVYFGRKDTVMMPYVTATAGYYHKSGLYASASASWLPSSGKSRIDLVSGEIGYMFTKGKFQGQASAYSFFFSNQSNNVKADLKGSLSFFGGYDFGFIKPVITPVLDISKKLDFAMMFGLEHTFYSDDNAFDITPAINANASTQNYYNSYYHDRKFRIKVNKVLTPVKAVVTGEVLNASTFKILDYEFTIPVNYRVKKFTFNFTPVYAVPVNAAVVSITRTVTSQAGVVSTKTRTGMEKLSHSFFWQGGVSYKF